MEVLYPCCAGLDVHKQTVVACVLAADPAGPPGVPTKQVRTFGTMTADLEQLRAWLVVQGCTHAVMEATGVYWKPVHNVLEVALSLVVVNPEHIKRVPGRKTDVSDAEWLATLLRHGLVTPSFVPDRDQREVRELTRLRTALIQDRARAVNRLQKSLEGANLKLASVLSDLTGVSGQRILDALLRADQDPDAAGGAPDPDPAEVAALAHWRVLQHKRDALERALVGRLSPTLRFVVSQELQQIRSLDEQLAACDAQVAATLRPFEAALDRLDGIPGVGRRTAETLLAEWTPQVGEHFATVGQLAAWSGLAPGNKESGGKRQRAHTRKGNPWVKRALTEAAWAAGRSKDSYLGGQFRHFAARKGRKHAVVVVGHSILVIAYYLLTREVDYADLGPYHQPNPDQEVAKARAIAQLTKLGYAVQLTPTPSDATTVAA
jgi:transposase